MMVRGEEWLLYFNNGSRRWNRRETIQE